MSQKFIITATTTPRQLTKIDYEKELNDEQREVVTGGDGPCLVLAGAGSGKTRTIVYRVAYLLERGVDPKNILLLTFTNKAAREMLGRVALLLGAPPSGLWGGTFHAVCHRLLRSLATRAGYRENFSILDEEDARDLVKSTLKDLDIDVKARRFPSSAVIQSILSYSRNARVPLEDALEAKHPRFLPLLDDFIKIASLYAEKKHSTNAMDFDDLLQVVLDLVKSNPDVRSRLADQFHYILVDEYQDTNPVQAELVTMLAARHGNLLVVGDDAQSIYSFRAADVRNILNFPKQFADTKIFRLETNYRSTPEILDLANDIITKNEAQFQKTLRPVKQPYVKPHLTPAASSAQEATFIAEMILQQRDEGVKLEDIAVLFRATHHSQSLEFELAKRDIPYEYRGGMRFFERSHIKDALAFLRVRANPADAIAWMRILGLQVGIGTAIAGRLANALAGAGSLKDALGVSVDELVTHKAKIGWDELSGVLGGLVALDRPAELVRAIGESRSYQDYLEAEYPNWQERLEDVSQLAVFAGEYNDLTEFLGEVSLFDDYGSARRQGAPTDNERMILSTIHQAKGLEWDTVFVMNLTAEDFPNRRALLEDGGLEEERRLFYVATTRAARQLFLTYPVTSGADVLAIKQPSPFLDELDPKLLEEVEIEETYEDPTIELDGDGTEKPRAHQYLRNINEL
ncbi:ATP-dependent helicase [Candidatus Uhrbacteria bacterium]|nr:ATP-dependent helicase [Candidatus Uhrbacteria bacterium]